jgi:FkbM family methyltransferase
MARLSRKCFIFIAIGLLFLAFLTIKISVNPDPVAQISHVEFTESKSVQASDETWKQVKFSESSFAYHQSPVVIAECYGRPGFKMSLPNYPHLRHWLADAIKSKTINVGADYLRYQDMFLQKRFSASAIMIDVGCNHGLAALPVAALGHKVICFEPVRYNYEKLMQSNLFNNFKYPMKIFNAALSDRSGNASIFVPSSRDDNASLNPAVSISNLPNSKIQAETVSMITLDEFLDSSDDQEFRQSYIEFIKIDVQGFEELVLKGAKNFLLRANVNLIIECEFSPKMIRTRGGNPVNLLTFMTDHGFHFSWSGYFQTPQNFNAFIHSLGDSQVDIEFVKKKINPVDAL